MSASRRTKATVELKGFCFTSVRSLNPWNLTELTIRKERTSVRVRGRFRHPRSSSPPYKEENRCSYHDRSRGNGEAIEALGVYAPRLNVKPCQTKSATSNEEERADPSDTTVRGQGPDIDKNSRRHAEGDYIGKRVKLQAKPLWSSW